MDGPVREHQTMHLFVSGPDKATPLILLVCLALAVSASSAALPDPLLEPQSPPSKRDLPWLYSSGPEDHTTRGMVTTADRKEHPHGSLPVRDDSDPSAYIMNPPW
ncbi:unnamed protein product [Jaminaea pallidilutea]